MTCSPKMIPLLVVLLVRPAFGQMDQAFVDLFDRILVQELQLSPGPHGNHFITAAEQANRELVPSLNSLVASNISSFPLSSTSAGVTFDFSSGQPVAVHESLGPIFMETAETLGKGRLNFGLNHTLLTMDKFRGVSSKDIRFTFTHVDVTEDGTLGESPNESDTIDVFLDLDLDATITALYATWGLTEHMDIGIAIPFVQVDMKGTARAQIQSFTLASLGMANHHFGSDPLNPILNGSFPYSESATGIGDASIRIKYGFLSEASIQLAFLIDVRFATGNQADFLGSGKPNVRISEILSKRIGKFTGHMNVGYEKRSGDLDSDELEFNVGFDQQLFKGVTLAVDFLADLDINDRDVITLFPGSVTITDHVNDSRITRSIDRGNIPERSNDNTLNASMGIRYAPFNKWAILLNMLVPLDDGGLRSDFVGTFGVNAQF